MTVVALSAAYGAGGAAIGMALAERLDAPFLDRAIPMAVASRLEIPFNEADALDEVADVRLLGRLASGFFPSDIAGSAGLYVHLATASDFRRAAEEIALQHASRGRGVILGRAAVVVLRGRPDVLRVRLSGSPERRLQQAMRLQRVDEATARRLLRRWDRAHVAYYTHYRAHPDDPALYHLMIDSTLVEFDVCVELIEQAATALVAA
jgi:cytidylate kinase